MKFRIRFDEIYHRSGYVIVEAENQQHAEKMADEVSSGGWRSVEGWAAGLAEEYTDSGLELDEIVIDGVDPE